MAIAVECPQCHHGFNVRDEYAGKRGKCPRCGGAFRAEARSEFDDFASSPATHRSGNGFADHGVVTTSKASGKRAGHSKAEGRAANRRPSSMPGWGWGAIGLMFLATGGAFAAAFTLTPEVGDLKKDAEKSAAATEKTRKATVKDVNAKLSNVEDEVTPLPKRIKEVAREKTIEDDVMPAIVKVLNFRPGPPPGMPAGTGTGWFFKIDDKLLVATNVHVVEQCTSLSIELQDGNKYPVEGFIAANKDLDLAILVPKDVPKDKIKSLRIAPNLGTVRTGDVVYACGNPGAHRHTITRGVVSRNVSMRQVQAEGAQTDNAFRLEPDQNIMWIEHDAKIWPGNSGGPLLNERFEVIGVNTRGMMVPMQPPSLVGRLRGFRLVPTFGHASNSMYILDMVKTNKGNAVQPLSGLPRMDR